ncbi:unnamed protein product [Sphenostylis stenocarpa]|uniref:Uncharacterized protein n=1 Tax=Sphenostylis stenocarpa TaxID=92480 RepID=A0AA86SPR3_9FABA|nr:unnamed protein product [Sphenostylis stenocarpa]
MEVSKGTGRNRVVLFRGVECKIGEKQRGLSKSDQLIWLMQKMGSSENKKRDGEVRNRHEREV